MAGHDERFTVIEEDELTLTVINPWQFEVGQCCVITRRHAPTILDLESVEDAAILRAAKRITSAMLAAFRPLGVLTYQNNGVYSGQEVPHYHYHVVPRQQGSDWGIGPPQLAVFPSAGRAAGTVFEDDDERRERVLLGAHELRRIAQQLRENLPA